mmetsp:Transcript_4178/g.17740  ORF Transcript_4178/g.17740 Transcript_4178/m.17740 type:complete len:470 (+) Transcript_4178:431-1840(+)
MPEAWSRPYSSSWRSFAPGTDSDLETCRSKSTSSRLARSARKPRLSPWTSNPISTSGSNASTVATNPRSNARSSSKAWHSTSPGTACSGPHTQEGSSSSSFSSGSSSDVSDPALFSPSPLLLTRPRRVNESASRRRVAPPSAEKHRPIVRIGSCCGSGSSSPRVPPMVSTQSTPMGGTGAPATRARANASSVRPAPETSFAFLSDAKPNESERGVEPASSVGCVTCDAPGRSARYRNPARGRGRFTEEGGGAEPTREKGPTCAFASDGGVCVFPRAAAARARDGITNASSSSPSCASHPWKRRCSRYPFCSSYLGEGGRSSAFRDSSPASSASAASPSPICAGPDWPRPELTPPEVPAASPTRSRLSSQASSRAFAAKSLDAEPSSSEVDSPRGPTDGDAAEPARRETRGGGWNGEGGTFTPGAAFRGGGGVSVSSRGVAGSSGVAPFSRLSGSIAILIRPRRRAYRSS